MPGVNVSVCFLKKKKMLHKVYFPLNQLIRIFFFYFSSVFGLYGNKFEKEILENVKLLHLFVKRTPKIGVFNAEHIS